MNFKFVFFLYLYLCLWKALQQSEGIVKEGDFLLAFQSRAEAKSEGLSGFRPKAASPPFCSTNFPKGSSWFFVIQQSYYTAASTIVNVSTKNLWFKLYSKVGGLKPILMSIKRVEDETKYIFVSSRTKMSTFIICEGQANFYIQYVYPCWFDTLSMCITIKKAKKDQSSVSIQILYKEYSNIISVMMPNIWLCIFWKSICLRTPPGAQCTPILATVNWDTVQPASENSAKESQNCTKNVFLIHCKQGGC